MGASDASLTSMRRYQLVPSLRYPQLYAGTVQTIIIDDLKPVMV